MKHVQFQREELEAQILKHRQETAPNTATKHSKGHNTILHRCYLMKKDYTIKKEDAIFTENLFLTDLPLKTLRQKGTLREAQEA